MSPKLKLEPEFEPHYTAWKAKPSPETASAVLTAVSPVIDTAMTSFAGGGKSPTLRSRARKIALDALPTYDPARGTLRTHLLGQLQGLRRFAAKERQLISLPEQVALDRIHLDRAGKELEDELGRPPSDQELMDRIGLSSKRLAHIRKAARPLMAGRFDPQGGEEDTSFAPAVRSLTQNDDAWIEFVYGDLGPIDQYILERSLGMRGHAKKAPGEIAADLNLSPGAVSQRMARIQDLLDQREERGLF